MTQLALTKRDSRQIRSMALTSLQNFPRIRILPINCKTANLVYNDEGNALGPMRIQIGSPEGAEQEQRLAVIVAPFQGCS